MKAHEGGIEPNNDGPSERSPPANSTQPSGSPSKYSLLVLFLICLLKLSGNFQELMLSYAFGFQGSNVIERMNPKYEILSSMPSLGKWYGVLSGPLYYFGFAFSGIIWGVAA